MSQTLLRHGLLIGALLLLTFLVPIYTSRKARLPVDAGTPVGIGIEALSALSLDITMTTNGTLGLFDVTHKGFDPITLNLPSSWARREVRGVALSDIDSDTKTIDYTRWHLPQSASISYHVPAMPPHLTVHNPNRVRIHLSITRVNLETDSATRDAVVITEATKDLW